MKKYIAGFISLVLSIGSIAIISLYTPYLENLELKGSKKILLDILRQK